MQTNVIIYRIGLKKVNKVMAVFLLRVLVLFHAYILLIMMLFEVLVTDMMVMCSINENENIRLGSVVMVQFVNPRFHPNWIGNVLSMSKCLHSYILLTWFHQNKYPFKINTLNTSQYDVFVQ